MAYALNVFGDRWTLLVVRDLLFSGKCSFSEFASSSEGIASNVLTDRLQRLEQAGLIQRACDPKDGRRVLYRLTERGLGLAPAMLEIVRWGVQNDPDTPVGSELRARLENDREGLLAQILERHRAACASGDPAQ